MARPFPILLLRLAFALGLATFAPVAAGAATYTVNIDSTMELGQAAAAATGDTVFRINPSTGAVTVQSGAGRRLSATAVRAVISVSCRPVGAADTACRDANVRMRVGVMGTRTGRARTMTFPTVAMGTAVLAVPPTGTSLLALELAPLGDNATKTFYVGADLPVAGDDSGLASGPGTSTFYVNVVDQIGRQLAGDADTAKVSVFRALSIGKTSDLNFGRIQVPITGSSTITLNAVTGVRSATGGAFLYPTPAPTRAAFGITGEGGQQVSLNVPTSVVLSGPGTLNVAVTSSAPASPTLSGGLGGAGNYSFTLGGSFTISSTTPTGAYSGVVTVSLDYN